MEAFVFDVIPPTFFRFILYFLSAPLRELCLSHGGGGWLVGGWRAGTGAETTKTRISRNPDQKRKQSKKSVCLSPSLSLQRHLVTRHVIDVDVPLPSPVLFVIWWWVGAVGLAHIYTLLPPTGHAHANESTYE
ncbi:hypothetical protein ACLOJK_010058 [Asimina triloba]